MTRLEREEEEQDLQRVKKEESTKQGQGDGLIFSAKNARQAMEDPCRWRSKKRGAGETASDGDFRDERQTSKCPDHHQQAHKNDDAALQTITRPMGPRSKLVGKKLIVAKGGEKKHNSAMIRERSDGFGAALQNLQWRGHARRCSGSRKMGFLEHRGPAWSCEVRTRFAGSVLEELLGREPSPKEEALRGSARLAEVDKGSGNPAMAVCRDWC